MCCFFSSLQTWRRVAIVLVRAFKHYFYCRKRIVGMDCKLCSQLLATEIQFWTGVISSVNVMYGGIKQIHGPTPKAGFIFSYLWHLHVQKSNITLKAIDFPCMCLLLFALSQQSSLLSFFWLKPMAPNNLSCLCAVAATLCVLVWVNPLEQQINLLFLLRKFGFYCSPLLCLADGL